MSFAAVRRLGLLIVAAFLLGACDADSLLETTWYKGTTKGFNTCKKAAEREGLTGPALTARCLESHEQPMADNSVTGVASFASFYEPQNIGSWGGEVKNNSKTEVVTSFTITLVSRTDPDMILLARTFSNRWIEPSDRAKFEFFEKSKEKGVWKVSEVKGIKISN
jgi:hypothetical protein